MARAPKKPPIPVGPPPPTTQQVVQDALAYPVLTEEVGYPPSPLSAPRNGATPGGAAGLGQMVNKTISDVLGWKAKSDDPKGFVGALEASFTGTQVDGHTEWAWSARTYAVQTDLGGGITGAQASIYTRAQEALNKSLPLLAGLYPLNPDSDAEDVTALKGIAQSQLNELVNELAFAGGPRVSRVNQYFGLLLANDGVFPPGGGLVTDPDLIGGTLGRLRDELGLNFQFQDFVNTLADEQDLSNFRILADYVTSLSESWFNNQSYFGLQTQRPFFGTQLVLLSRQLSVVAESVDEVRFTLDSVFLGPAERQTLVLPFPAALGGPLFLEDVLSWVQNFAAEEGPRLIQDGGKFGVTNSVQPIAQRLSQLISSAAGFTAAANPGIPRGYFQPRVNYALEELEDQLLGLIQLASGIQHQIPSVATPPLTLFAVAPNSYSQSTAPTSLVLQIFGQGFQVGDPPGVVPSVSLTGSIAASAPPTVQSTFFVSSSHLIVTLSPTKATPDSYQLMVTNPDGNPAPQALVLTVTA